MKKKILTGRDLLALPEITWLWPGYIPIGHLTLVAGEPGSGKSAFAQDLAFRLSNGSEWADGSEITEPSKTLWIDSDGAKSILADRLRNWEMNPDDFILPGQTDIYADFGLISNSKPQIKEILEEMNPRLVVIDSLTGVHRQEEKDASDMKDLFDILQEWAGKFNCAVVIIHHLNKGFSQIQNGPITLDRIRGSTQIVASARSILVIDTGSASIYPAFEKTQRIYQIKNNLDKIKENPFYFEIGGDGITYLPMEDFNFAPNNESQKEKAKRRIMEIMHSASGPIPSKEIESKLNADFPEPTWKRAKKELPVESFRPEGENRWFWRIIEP